jgi:hypothetical protein
MPALRVVSLDYEEGGRSFAVKGPEGSRVSLELLDHHRVKRGSKTVRLGPGWTPVTIAQKEGEWGELLRVRAGEASHDVTAWDSVNEGLGGSKALEWDDVERVRVAFRKTAR